jgi:hypothetical protein
VGKWEGVIERKGNQQEAGQATTLSRIGNFNVNVDAPCPVAPSLAELEQLGVARADKNSGRHAHR